MMKWDQKGSFGDPEIALIFWAPKLAADQWGWRMDSSPISQAASHQLQGSSHKPFQFSQHATSLRALSSDQAPLVNSSPVIFSLFHFSLLWNYQSTSGSRVPYKPCSGPLLRINTTQFTARYKLQKVAEKHTVISCHWFFLNELSIAVNNEICLKINDMPTAWWLNL